MKQHKWARLIRFVDLDDMPVGMAAVYDPVKNLVRIDRDLFKVLNTHEQTQLMFTEGDVVFKANQ